MTKFSLNDAVPFEPTHPGEVLDDELKARGIKQKDFAKTIGVQASYLNDFIKGRCNLTEELAHKLDEALGISYDMWIRLHEGYLYDSERIRERNSKE